MRSRKGQVSFFIIIVIVIFIAVSFVLYLKKPDIESRNSALEGVSDFSLDTSAVKNALGGCMKAVGEEGIGLVASQGGYFEIPQMIKAGPLIKTSYHFYNNRIMTPSKETVEREISRYIKQNLGFCLEKIRNFEEYEIKFNNSVLDIVASIQKNRVTLDLYSTIELSGNENRAEFPRIKISIEDTELYDLYESGREIINEQSKDPSSLCLSCILESTTKRNQEFEIVQSGDLDFTILLIKNSTPQNKKLVYSFAIKYQNVSCSNIPDYLPEKSLQSFLLKCTQEKLNEKYSKPKLEQIKNLTATVEKPFAYELKASGTNLVFSDFTDLFEVSREGKIRFTPKKEEAGNHTVWIKVEDSLKNKDYGSFELEIKNE